MLCRRKEPLTRKPLLQTVEKTGSTGLFKNNFPSPSYCPAAVLSCAEKIAGRQSQKNILTDHLPVICKTYDKEGFYF